MRLTKLICTLGPTSADRVDELVAAGMDVARVNFSHGSDESRRAAVEAVRRAAEKAGRAIGVLADLSGPKIRLGELVNGAVTLERGHEFTLRGGTAIGNAQVASVSYDALAQDLHAGDRVQLADGAVELRVLATDGAVRTEVVVGGTLRSRAGVNVPSHRVSLPALTDKDLRDIEQAMALGADFIAQSFVRQAGDVRQLREQIGDRRVQIVAKLETTAALEDAENILREADVVMLARGDLGMDQPREALPVIQKNLIRLAAGMGVPTIVATHMLESMIAAPNPTRAEASDVANAVFDGADAILLSAETAIGHYPVEAAEMAVRIAAAAERDGPEYFARHPVPAGSEPVHELARAAAAIVAANPDVRAIACLTETGRTARVLSAARAQVPILALCTDPTVERELTICHGVVSMGCTLPPDTDATIALLDRRLRESSYAPVGASVLVVAATPVGAARTNLLKVHRVGDWPSPT